MSSEVMSEQPFLALGGEHGRPEQTGQALVKSCQENRIADWEVMIANEAADLAGLRYVKYNMSSVYDQMTWRTLKELSPAKPIRGMKITSCCGRANSL